MLVCYKSNILVSYILLPITQLSKQVQSYRIHTHTHTPLTALCLGLPG